MRRAIVGLDIGGANLKAAHIRDTDTVCLTHPFALWRSPERLEETLRFLLEQLPPAEVLVLTMTGELCDCFSSKREGVLHILKATEQAASGRPCLVWGSDGRFRSLEEARAAPTLVIAAANWLALAIWAGRFASQGPALLLDIGSTTSDLILLVDGIPLPMGRTDQTRLQSRELVYTGVRRTPLAALLPHVAAELFATTLDAYLLLEDIPPNEEDRDTADGRPATIENAHSRIARMLCAEEGTTNPLDRIQLARQAQAVQLRLLNEAMETVRRHLPLETIILSGSGEFLGCRLLVEQQNKTWHTVHSLSTLLGPATSTAACAYAAAILCREREEEL